ncbi:MMPL family transporter [Actinotalea sp. M2MS4P-6]|uniref:MMPL family transporter n=1 Tax=Actinotalea sp. M2MS4P-6 TaxID=2983762 RepID=UPI0021E3C5A8|nr:MMPL family transporter [Actinotalea sp. M2MS4P-6]MCV2393764.1 MMPL family transporter [Actinotalea sp. M2MS4P-6]
MLSNETRRGLLRGLAIVIVIAAWLGIGAVGGMSIGRLSDVQQNDAASFLPSGAESTRAAEAAAAFSDSETLPALVVAEADGAMSADQLAAMQTYADGVGALPLGDGTVSDVLAAPVVVVPSQDGEAALVTVVLDAASASEQIGEERVVNLVVAELRDAATPLADAGLTVHVTGPAGAVADLVSAFGGIDSLLLLVALGVVFVILVLVYRSPSLPFTVLFTSLFALAGAALVVYQLAANDVLVLNGQSQGILFILVVGAATDYSLLIVARYREELRWIAAPHRAMGRAIRASIEPIAASAGTVIAGLLCLLLSDLRSNSSLGPVAAIGIAASFVASLTLLPALLLVGGRYARWIFWPRMPHPADTADPDDVEGAEPLEHLEARSGVWGRVAGLIGRHPRRVWVVTAGALLLASAFVPTFKAQGTGESDVFLTAVDSVAGEKVLAQHFDAGVVQPATVIVPEGEVDAVVAAAASVPGVISATPYTGAQSGPPGAGGGETADPVVVDGRVLVQVVTQAAAETQEASDVVAEVRTAVHEVAPDALVGGAAAQRLDTQQTSARDLRVIVPSVLAVILVVLIFLLRAVLAPVLIVVANLLSFGATLGVSALVFNHVLGFPGADATVPLYGFVFLVALGIDYSIFLMTRVREESLRHGTREGVRRGLAVTGGVITSAGLVLASTFGALAVIPLLFLAQIAFIVAFGVLLDTLVVRTLLVPGVVHDLGRVVWWPWHRRIAD